VKAIRELCCFFFSIFFPFLSLLSCRVRLRRTVTSYVAVSRWLFARLVEWLVRFRAGRRRPGRVVKLELAHFLSSLFKKYSLLHLLRSPLNGSPQCTQTRMYSAVSLMITHPQTSRKRPAIVPHSSRNDHCQFSHSFESPLAAGSEPATISFS